MLNMGECGGGGGGSGSSTNPINPSELSVSEASFLFGELGASNEATRVSRLILDLKFSPDLDISGSGPYIFSKTSDS